MESCIIAALKGKDKALKEKKLKKAVIHQLDKIDKAVETDNFDADFKASLDVLVMSGRLACNDDRYSLVSESTVDSSKVSRKRGHEEESSSDRPSKYPELWKNGEKYWREGTMDFEYLKTNPDK